MYKFLDDVQGWDFFKLGLVKTNNIRYPIFSNNYKIEQQITTKKHINVKIQFESPNKSEIRESHGSNLMKL